MLRSLSSRGSLLCYWFYKGERESFWVKWLVFIGLRDKAVLGPRSRVIHRGVQDSGRVLIGLLEQRKLFCASLSFFMSGPLILGSTPTSWNPRVLCWNIFGPCFSHNSGGEFSRTAVIETGRGGHTCTPCVSSRWGITVVQACNYWIVCFQRAIRSFIGKAQSVVLRAVSNPPIGQS